MARLRCLKRAKCLMCGKRLKRLMCLWRLVRIRQAVPLGQSGPFLWHWQEGTALTRMR